MLAWHRGGQHGGRSISERRMRTRMAVGVGAEGGMVAAGRLGAWFIAEFLVHGKAAEVSTPALNALLGIHMKAVVIEKGTACKTGVRKDSQAAF